MANITERLTDHRAALDELVATLDRAEGVWTTPRAPGKWSPSQLVEHVARSLEEGANVFAGRPSRLPSIPFFLRPVVRALVFRRVLRREAFPRAKTNKAMDPESGPATPAEARQRLLQACEAFERAAIKRAESGYTMTTATFGAVPVIDYVRFMELHTRHHLRQMPEA